MRLDGLQTHNRGSVFLISWKIVPLKVMWLLNLGPEHEPPCSCEGQYSQANHPAEIVSTIEAGLLWSKVVRRYCPNRGAGPFRSSVALRYTLGSFLSTRACITRNGGSGVRCSFYRPPDLTALLRGKDESTSREQAESGAGQGHDSGGQSLRTVVDGPAMLGVRI